MKNIAITRTKNTVSATFLPYTSYKRAIELADALKGKIGKTADGTFKATFNSVKTAEKFVATWTEEYNANRKVSVESTATPSKKPSASKGKAEELTAVLNGVKYKLVPIEETASSSKKKTDSKKSEPKKSKGVAFDFGKIKGKTNADKNKALHKELVKMGLDDSRTPEYMSVWNARPWAK